VQVVKRHVRPEHAALDVVAGLDDRGAAELPVVLDAEAGNRVDRPSGEK
jgi:hypothetical protein